MAMDPVEYVVPSAAARRKAVLLVAGATAVAALIQFVARPRFFAFLSTLPPCEQLPWLQGLLLALLVAVAVLGLWGLWRSRRLLQHQQWPLPDAWLLGRKRIQRGLALKARAYGLVVVSCLCLAMPFMGWSMLDRIGFLSTPARCQGGPAH